MLLCFAAAASASTAAAEDPAERRFFTPALPPKHQDKPPVRLNQEPVGATTDFVDENPWMGPQAAYWVCPVVEGRERAPSGRVRLKSDAERSRRHYASIKFQGPYTPQRIAVGDLNADGEYDFVLKQPSQGIDPAGRPGPDDLTYSAGGSRSGGPRPAQSSVVKHRGPTLTTGIEGTIVMTADLMGDWREEIVTVLPGELRIYTTTLRGRDRRVCLMQDPVYRAEVAHRSMGYEQSPVPGYYLGLVPPAGGSALEADGASRRSAVRVSAGTVEEVGGAFSGDGDADAGGEVAKVP